MPLNTAAAATSRGVWIALFTIAMTAVLLYANTFRNPFVFDDFSTVGSKTFVGGVRTVGNLFSAPLESPLAGRPFANATFVLNVIFGGLDVRGYHAVSIAFHVLSALTLFLLVARTLALEGIPRPVREQSVLLAFVTAWLWTIHPLNSEVVDYLTERTESIMALCYLLTLYASLRAFQAPGRRLWPVLAVLASAAGMASKESMVTVPVMVVLYDRVFLFDSLKRACLSRWRLYGAVAATWLVLAVLMASHPRTLSNGFASVETSPWNYLLNQSVMIARYLRLSVWPQGLVIYYGLVPTVRVTDVWPYLLLVVALVAAAGVLFVRRPRLGFLALWIVITLSPTSSVVPIGAEVGAERRMYLPLAGFLGLAVIGGALLWDRARRRWFSNVSARTLALGGIAVFCLVSAPLVTATVRRNREYASALTLARTVLARWPTPAAENMVGTELSAVGDHREAIGHLTSAAKAYPPARLNVVLEFINLDDVDKAAGAVHDFAAAAPDDPLLRDARLALARVLEAKHQWAPAIEQCQRVLAGNPGDIDAHGLLADAFRGENAFAQAIPEYQVYASAHPDDPAAWTSLGVAAIGAERVNDAVAAFRHAVDADPHNGSYRRNLAKALMAQGNLHDAGQQAQEAVAWGPNDASSHETLGLVLELAGQTDQARQELQQALRLNPQDAVAAIELRRLGSLHPAAH